MTERELILYAWPTGPLADDLATYFTEVTNRFGPTVAQTYPIHCTLTGFFRRRDGRADEVLSHLGQVVADVGPPPEGAIRVERLGVHEEWLGLELGSTWLLELIDTVVEADRPRADEDALRPKRWMHLSLAYGTDDLGPYVDFARSTVDLSRPASWNVGFWERHVNGAWTQHRLSTAG
jgi:hypothetical protein